MYDVVIVGSGPAGVHAARQLSLNSKLRIAVVDVGHLPPTDKLASSSIVKIRQSEKDYFPELIGERFETLHNITNDYLMPKLKAPLLRFVTDPAQPSLSPIRNGGFLAVESFAQGGLANVWGAQVYPFSAAEISDFPISIDELNPYYQELAEHIGISGSKNDDLTKFMGIEHSLQPEIAAGALEKALANRYHRVRSRFQRAGVSMGKPRLAVLSQAHRGRRACSYSNLEFFKSRLPEIYNPAFTLDELIQDHKIEYISGRLVQTFTDDGAGVTVSGINLIEQTKFSLQARKVFLAAGTLNTAKIVLRTKQAKNQTLPLLDNQISYIPLVAPRLLGTRFDPQGYTTALNIVVQDQEFANPLFGTIYGTNGIFRSELIFDFPLSMRFKLHAARQVLPALGVLQMWYPDAPQAQNFLRLEESGQLSIQYEQTHRGRIERKLCGLFLRSGFVTAPQLCRYPGAGNSFHYAGTLPMKKSPGPFQTDKNGLLFGEKSVYVIDGSVFPSLPSKNLTFSIMANAMRIAKLVGQSLI